MAGAKFDSPDPVRLFPLVTGVRLPRAASARTRVEIPPGYGVREHCLPFTAASALGYLVESPISFGLCPEAELPAAARAFRSPVEPAPGTPPEERLFYVLDDPGCSFAGNAYTLDLAVDVDKLKPGEGIPVEPGLSFFDRPDQTDLFKIHLPYLWRTRPEVDALFLPPINRDGPRLEVLCGLVETDWYASPVNLVLRKPAAGEPLHVAAGEPLAQVVFLVRGQRRPELEVLAGHARMARDLRREHAEWRARLTTEPAAYKRLARSRHGRVADDETG